MQSRFRKIYNSYIVEQDAAAAPVAEPEASALPAPTETAPTETAPDIDNQQPEPDAQLDTSGFVTLVRLLKDAFVIRPDDEDADKIIGVGEINGDNVYDKFAEILTLIKKYNPDIDIDMETDLSKIK